MITLDVAPGPLVDFAIERSTQKAIYASQYLTTFCSAPLHNFPFKQMPTVAIFWQPARNIMAVRLRHWYSHTRCLRSCTDEPMI